MTSECKMKSLFQSSFLFICFQFLYCTTSVAQCPKNMRLYRANATSDVTYCDCFPTFLYHPEDDSCYDAYKQGPCPTEHYLVLPPDKMVAKCEKNPCRIDGLVPFQGKCHILWESGNPCKDVLRNFLGINENFAIQCGMMPYIGDYETMKMSKSCPENTQLVSRNEDHTNYTCDCVHTYLRDSKNKTCYKAYRQGPCPSGHYFVLPQDEKEARCEKNPCQEDGLVSFKGGCHHVYTQGPCPSDKTLTFRKYSFELACVFNPPTYGGGGGGGGGGNTGGSGGGGGGSGGIIGAPTKVCPPGSRRVYTTCKHVFQ